VSEFSGIGTSSTTIPLLQPIGCVMWRGVESARSSGWTGPEGLGDSKLQSLVKGMAGKQKDTQQFKSHLGWLRYNKFIRQRILQQRIALV
jgi:hypothetical protein